MKAPIYICGPTASGKSGYAIQLARELDGEVVNCDAYQLYSGIEVLAASPTVTERAQVPHHLFSVLSTSDKLDAARYRNLAEPVIREIQQRNKTPIVVGGSGLYLKFLTHGPSPVPAGDSTLRADLENLTLEELQNRLQKIDPAEAESINLLNRRYVTRSLELCLLTGKPVSEMRKDWQQPDPPNLTGYYLDWPKDELNARIAQRSAAMLADGAIEEVANLPPNAATAAKAIGVKEIRRYLAGEVTKDESIELITIATRQYAKRQRTWFQKEKWLQKINQPSSGES